MDFYENSDLSPGQLTPREHVRKRPGMYIGGTDSRAVNQMIFYLLDLIAAEALSGRCQCVGVTLQADGWIVIDVDGAGMPVDRYKDTPFTQMEVLLQDIDLRDEDIDYGVYELIGLHLYWMGIGTINALSAEMTVENKRDGYLWRQAFSAGKPTTPLAQVRALEADEPTGTVFCFRPDEAIFGEHRPDVEGLARRCEALTALIAGVSMRLRDERVTPIQDVTFYAPDGLQSMVLALNARQTPLHDPIYIKQTITLPGPTGTAFSIGVEVAFQFCVGRSGQTRNFVNAYEPPDGGTHVAAVKAAVLACLNEYLEYYSHVSTPLTWPEISGGFSAAVAVFHPHPIFQAATRRHLHNPEVFGVVAGLVFSVLQREQDTVETIVRHYRPALRW